MALIRAAQAYDQIGRYDSAVAIYRSLGQSPDVSLQLMMLWLKNCQRRNDREEAGRVACDLGDRALNDGDVPGAREWFERARLYDPTNELAARRLKSLEGGAENTAAAAAPAAPAELPPPSVSALPGHLNVKTERDEPVVVDLGVLIDEFQRAIEPELASDPQGHYDLGVSYREMGLTEQAVQSLRVAAKAPAFRLRAGELAGRCLLDLGRFDEAADALRDTLKAPDLLPSAAVDLRYQLALALEAAGHSAKALAEFERVYAAQANYPDVAMKIRLLRKMAGAA
jgi:tetratricopeptide (TPR) repeat protein